MRIRHIMLAAGVAFALASCSTGKSSLIYFEDLKSTDSGVLNVTANSLRIMPDDELFITVNSLEPTATMHYNLPLVNPGQRESLGGAMSATPQIQTYIVDRDGNIDFPVLGKLHVEGLTTMELTEELVKQISKDVNDPQVRVELLTFNVNVLGEVRNPGRINTRRQSLSVLDAVSLAGDLTEYGERSNVMVIREENGKMTYHRLNLGNSEMFSSPYFYLQQNDIVYIEPNKIKQENSKYNTNNAYKLSMVSTIVGIASVIASLVIALTVK